MRDSKRSMAEADTDKIFRIKYTAAAAERKFSLQLPFYRKITYAHMRIR